jgi:hypothetical protein
MERRGKQYNVIQGLDNMWKVRGLVGQIRSGKNHVLTSSERSTKLRRRKSNACSVQNERGRQPRRAYNINST